MSAFFRRLSIGRKLLVSSLVFALPIAVLAYFMDISFVHDINIARTEMEANSYGRAVFRVVGLVQKHHFQLQEKGRDTAEARETGREVEAAFKTLLEQDRKLAARLQTNPKDLAAKGLSNIHPARLWERWEAWRSDPALADPGLDMTKELGALLGYVAKTGQLVLDPALDSHHLADVVVRDVPRVYLRLVEFRFLAESEGFFTPAGSMDESTRQQLWQTAALCRADHLKIVETSREALAEDTRFYGASPSLQSRYSAVLNDFDASHNMFLDLVEQTTGGDSASARDELLVDWGKAVAGTEHLFMVGSEELDILLHKRIESFSAWRKAGYGFGAAAILVAGLFVYFISMGIVRPVKALTGYAGRVSRGEYDAELDMGLNPPGGELAELAQGIEIMVGELKHRLAFSRGVLESIVAPFLVADTAGHVTFVNKAMLDLLEYSGLTEEYIGQEVTTFFRDGTLAVMVSRQCGGGEDCPPGGEVALTGVRGGEKMVAVSISSMEDFQGAPSGASVFLFDLTELKRRQREIEEKNQEIERLAAIPRENPRPVLTADREGGITYCNPAAGQLLETLGVDIKGFLPSQHGELVRSCLTTGQPRQQVEHNVKDRVFSWSYSPLPSHGLVQIHGQDVTERKRMEEQLLHDAFHDGLTGLANRALFLDRLSQRLRRAKRAKGGKHGRSDSYAVMFMDMDRFKLINDSMGHEAGDTLLKAIAERMGPVLRIEDTLARLGGDEYVVLLDKVEGVRKAVAATDRIQEALAESFVVEGRELFISASIGLVVDSGRYVRAEDVLRDADTAMYRAKSQGRARSEVFDQEMHQSARLRMETEMDLKRAVDKGEFRVFYQPLVCMRSGRIRGFEALVRWQHPERGMVSPGEFIPLAEETGLIVPMGAYVLEEACRQAVVWRSSLPEFDDLLMSVNLSVRQFSASTLLEDIHDVLERTGFPPEALKLEITESGIMENAEVSVKLLGGLKDMRIRLSIDDFGTGYSSLAYLPRFPFDYLKVDQSFVMSMEDQPENREIVKTIVSLAHGLDKEVIAEGIETEPQLARLRGLGCEFGQGYLFAKPLPPGEAEEMLRRNPRW
jgi:diguanylate cyclase (GGDEF)-like protein/PAS domain S-box-containing protein